eukprot:2509799-Pyramimonas_sp.AAC.1
MRKGDGERWVFGCAVCTFAVTGTGGPVNRAKRDITTYGAALLTQRALVRSRLLRDCKMIKCDRRVHQLGPRTRNEHSCTDVTKVAITDAPRAVAAGPFVAASFLAARLASSEHRPSTTEQKSRTCSSHSPSTHKQRTHTSTHTHTVVSAST